MLGNCYFLATLSAFAEFPEIVQKVFNNKVANKYGVYTLNFNISGKYQEIIVDDYFPCTE